MSLKKFIKGKIYYSTLANLEGSGSTTHRGRKIPEVKLFRCVEKEEDNVVLLNVDDATEAYTILEDRRGKFPRLTKKRLARMRDKLEEARSNTLRYSDLIERIESKGLEDEL